MAPIHPDHHHHHHKCCQIKQKLRRGLWSPQEDEKLMNHIKNHGPCSWSSVPQLAGLERCGKSCRLRWINYLRPNLKRGSFTPIEEQRIIELHSILGNKWSKIASFFPGRTDNEIKNLWNSSLKKKLESRSLRKQPLITSQTANHTEITTNHSYNQGHGANDAAAAAANQGSFATLIPSTNHPPPLMKPTRIIHTPADHNAVRINPSLINFPFALPPNDQSYSPTLHNHPLNPAPNHAQTTPNHVQAAPNQANELLLAAANHQPWPLITTSLQAMAEDQRCHTIHSNHMNQSDRLAMGGSLEEEEAAQNGDDDDNHPGGGLMTWVYVNQAQLGLIRELNHHHYRHYEADGQYSALMMGGGGGDDDDDGRGPWRGPDTGRGPGCHVGWSDQSPTSTCTTAMGGGGDTSCSLPSLLDNCSEDDVNLWFGEQEQEHKEEEEEEEHDILSSFEFPL